MINFELTIFIKRKKKCHERFIGTPPPCWRCFFNSLSYTLVRTGIERAYGNKLKYNIRHVISKSLFAVNFGLFTAMILQCSPAITPLISSFVESGFVSGVTGLMAVRGGELGSALVVKILTYDLTLVVQLCLL